MADDISIDAYIIDWLKKQQNEINGTLIPLPIYDIQNERSEPDYWRIVIPLSDPDENRIYL